MSIGSLRRHLKRLSQHAGLRRCACGAILAASVTQPRRIDIIEGYNLPDSLAALVSRATPAEALELQTLLNRCLALRPELAERRGTSHQIYGGPPSDSALLRFHFAESGEGRPQCPRCGTVVAGDQAVCAVALLAPPPEDLLDGQRLDPELAARLAELTTRWQQRAGLETASLPRRELATQTGGLL